MLLLLLVSAIVWLALVWKLFSKRTTGASTAGAIATVGSADKSSCRRQEYSLRYEHSVDQWEVPWMWAGRASKHEAADSATVCLRQRCTSTLSLPVHINRLHI